MSNYTKKKNDAIGKWLDRRYEDRTRAIKARAQRTGQTSIISLVRPIELRRQNNSKFQIRLQDARRAALPTRSNTVDGHRSSIEPPD